MKPNYRSLRIFGFIGLVLLVISAAGAIFATNGGHRGTAKTPGDAHVHLGPIVCYGNIDVPSGVTPLFPLQPGRVLEVKINESESVKKGAVLIRLDDRLAQFRLTQAKADYEAAKAQLEQAGKGPEQYQAKTEQQQAAVDAMKAKWAAAKLVHERKKELQGTAVNEKEVLAAKELAKEAEAGLRAEEAKLKELKLIDPQTQLKRAEADEAAKKAQLDQAQLAVDECAVVAPADGEVLQVLVGPGTILVAHPSQPAIMFAPAGQRIIRAEVEQEFASRLSAGEPVIVQDEHGSGSPRTGKVARVSDWYTRSRTQVPDMTRILSNEARTLECIITLDPGQASFRLGQRVRVTVGKSSE
jgi:multidrug resistance efflux pump